MARGVDYLEEDRPIAGQKYFLKSVIAGQDGKVYEQWTAYGQSKTANILFARALAEKLGARGLRAYSLHPGVAFGTSLAPHGLTEEDIAGIGKWSEWG